MEPLPGFDTPEYQVDLHANNRRLRQQDPVHEHVFQAGLRVSLMRYDDVLAAFKDERFATIPISGEIVEGLEQSGHTDLVNLAHVVDNIMIIKDPPHHTRLRGLVSRAFTPRAVERLRPRIQAIVRELIDEVSEASGMDLIADFAEPLPAIAIAELLGVPIEDRLELKSWSDDFTPIVDRTLTSAGALLPAAAAATRLVEYFGRIVAARRRDPREDLISALVAARDEDDALSDRELIATCILILVAGHETTTNLIGNGAWTLLRHPERMAGLREDPDLHAGTVEELLRLESPIQRFVRWTLEDVTVRGTRIPKSTVVDLSIGSANRDPAQFARPDELDPLRADNRHLAFGFGRHFCLGSTLARLEAQTAFRELATRLPKLALATDTAESRPGSILRGLYRLPVTF